MTVDELLKEADELFAKKDFRRLKWACIKILEQDEDNEKALAYQAYVYWDRADWYDSIELRHVFEIAEKVHRLYPDNYHAYNVEAMAYLDEGDFERALECCDDGLKIKDYYWLKINRVESLICLDRIEEAFEFYKSLDILFYSFEKALINCARLSELSRYCGEVSNDMILDYLFEKRKYVWNDLQIRKDLENKLKQDENDEIALTYMAFDHLNSNMYEEALETAEKIHRLFPDNYHAYDIEARACLHMAQFERALECCDDGLNVKDCGSIKINKIEALICLERIDEAFELYKISQIPNYNFINSLVRCEKYSEIPDYNEDMSNEELVECLLNKCRYLVNSFSRGYEGIKRKYAKALMVCDEIFKIDRDNEIALGYRIIALKYLDRYDELMECANRAIELYPDNFRFYFLRAEFLWEKMLDFDAAIDDYGKAAELDRFEEIGSYFFIDAVHSMISQLRCSKKYADAIPYYEKIMACSHCDEERLAALFDLDRHVEAYGIDYEPSENYRQTIKSFKETYCCLTCDIGRHDGEYIEGCRRFKGYDSFGDYLKDYIICIVELCPAHDEKAIREDLKSATKLKKIRRAFESETAAYDSAFEYMERYNEKMDDMEME